ncbi:MAG: hypothetical protein H5U04_03560 [Firmicutes bacterium]|nr:hypothetical protein [Bacillota bacterium]
MESGDRRSRTARRRRAATHGARRRAPFAGDPDGLRRYLAQLEEDQQPPITPAVGLYRAQTGFWVRKLRSSPYRRVVGVFYLVSGLMGLAVAGFERSLWALLVTAVGALLVAAGISLLRGRLRGRRRPDAV